MLPPPAWVLKLEAPKPTPFPFESVFGQVDQVTLDALKRFSQLRDEVAGALAKSAADAGIMVCIEEGRRGHIGKEDRIREKRSY